jgi:hypothetical protein
MKRVMKDKKGSSRVPILMILKPKEKEESHSPKFSRNTKTDSVTVIIIKLEEEVHGQEAAKMSEFVLMRT